MLNKKHNLNSGKATIRKRDLKEEAKNRKRKD